MLFGRKKEKKVQELIVEHLNRVSATLMKMEESVKLYLKDDIKEAKEFGYQAHLMEKEADAKRREIIEKLHQGAFLPAFREDLIHLAAQQDKIADRSESCCDFILTQRPDVPAKFRAEFETLLTGSIKTFAPYREAVEGMFEDYEIVRKKIKEVNALEEETDTIEWHLARDIFSSDIDLAKKMHLSEFIFHIAEISDVTEDAADDLDVFIVKVKI